MSKYSNRKVNENVLIRREVTLRKKLNDANLSKKEHNKITSQLQEIQDILKIK